MLLKTLAYLQLLVCLLPNACDGEVVRMQVNSRKPFAEGHRFGRTGAYEAISGRLYFEVDPQDSANERITDLQLAPVNQRGKVEFWSDFFLLKPQYPAQGNGVLLYDVHNRGNKLALWTFNEGIRSNAPLSRKHAGNGFLLKQGYTLLWTGWNGDVVADGTNRLLAGLPIAKQKDGSAITGKNYVEISVNEPVSSQPFFGSPWGTSAAYPSVTLDNKSAKLTMRAGRDHPAQVVPHSDWAFARDEQGEIVPDAASLYLKNKFRPGWLYELVYTAKNPRVAGLGLAGLRDAVSFFRYEKADAVGNANPMANVLNRAYIFGISQSGRLIHHFLYEGLNTDAEDRTVFDAALIHVAGAGKGLFNYRFGMATVYGTYRRSNLMPADFFPFTPIEQTDPVTNRTGDSLARIRKRKRLPKIFFVQTSTEYWSRAASLLHTDVKGTRDLQVDPQVRIYLIAGTHHLGGGSTDRGICQYLQNPLKHRGPVLRALLNALDDWVQNRHNPPASQYPRIKNKTLVDLNTFRKQFPQIPGVKTPGQYYQPLRLNPGDRWFTTGIADNVPPESGPAYRTLVPAVDADGNELAGIRLPEIQVPLATYTGWNLREKKYGAGGIIAGLFGGYFPLPVTKSNRSENTDPRLAIRERYPTRAVYLEQYTEAVLKLVRQRFLLDQDAINMIEQASQRDYWQRESNPGSE